MDFFTCKAAFIEAVNYIRDSIFDPDGVTYDNPDILPVATLEYTDSRKLGRLWDAAVTYQVGDVVTYDFDIYVALTSNTNANPMESGSDWSIFYGNQLASGEYPEKAWVCIDTYQNNGAILGSSGIASVYEVETDVVFQVLFDPSANITNTDYIVAITLEVIGYDTISKVFDKTTAGFKVRLSSTNGIYSIGVSVL